MDDDELNSIFGMDGDNDDPEGKETEPIEESAELIDGFDVKIFEGGEEVPEEEEYVDEGDEGEEDELPVPEEPVEEKPRRMVRRRPAPMEEPEEEVDFAEAEKKFFEEHPISVKAVLLGILGVVLIVCIVLVFTLDAFKVKKINVEGNYVIPTEKLTELSGIQTNDHIFFTNYTKAAREIKSYSPYVRSCSVTFALPSEVNIKINERSKISYVKTPDGYAALDDEGTVLELISDGSTVAPVISGLKITNATLGREIVITDSADYQKALIVLGSLLTADANNQNGTYRIFENTQEVRVLPSGYIFLTIKLPNNNLLQVKLNSLEKISSDTAWLLYAIESKVFNDGFPKGSLDMTGEEYIYRQFIRQPKFEEDEESGTVDTSESSESSETSESTETTAADDGNGAPEDGEGGEGDED